MNKDVLEILLISEETVNPFGSDNVPGQKCLFSSTK